MTRSPSDTWLGTRGSCQGQLQNQRTRENRGDAGGSDKRHTRKAFLDWRKAVGEVTRKWTDLNGTLATTRGCSRGQHARRDRTAACTLFTLVVVCLFVVVYLDTNALALRGDRSCLGDLGAASQRSTVGTVWLDHTCSYDLHFEFTFIVSVRRTLEKFSSLFSTETVYQNASDRLSDWGKTQV